MGYTINWDNATCVGDPSVLDLTPEAIAELEDANGQVSHTFGVVQNIHADVVLLFDQLGNVRERASYAVHGARTLMRGADTCIDAVGEPCISGWGNPLAFAGARLSPVSGMLDMRARHYDLTLRQFVSPDPLLYIDSFDVWLYAAGDALHRWDPFGLDSQSGDIGGSRRLSLNDVGNFFAGAGSVALADGLAVVVGGTGLVGGTAVCVATGPLCAIAGTAALVHDPQTTLTLPLLGLSLADEGAERLMGALGADVDSPAYRNGQIAQTVGEVALGVTAVLQFARLARNARLARLADEVVPMGMGGGPVDSGVRPNSVLRRDVTGGRHAPDRPMVDVIADARSPLYRPGTPEHGTLNPVGRWASVEAIEAAAARIDNSSGRQVIELVPGEGSVVHGVLSEYPFSWNATTWIEVPATQAIAIPTSEGWHIYPIDQVSRFAGPAGPRP